MFLNCWKFKAKLVFFKSTVHREVKWLNKAYKGHLCIKNYLLLGFMPEIQIELVYNGAREFTFLKNWLKKFLSHFNAPVGLRTPDG